MVEEGIKFDEGKIDWTLLPFSSMEQVIRVLQFGADKYSRDNWKKVEASRYLSATFRHLIAYNNNEHTDPESGFSHLAHCICCLIFLLHKEEENGKGKNIPSETPTGGTDGAKWVHGLSEEDLERLFRDTTYYPWHWR